MRGGKPSQKDVKEAIDPPYGSKQGAGKQSQALGVQPQESAGNPMMKEAVPAVSAYVGLGNVSVVN